MEIELCCAPCGCRFAAAPEASRDTVMDRMTDDGTWFGLAEGSTFEDMIFAALLTRGAIACPECRELVEIREASIGELVDQVSQVA